MPLLAREPDYPADPQAAGHPVEALRLIRSENVGPITFHQLIQRYGTPAKALERIPELARQGGSRRPIRICSEAAAQEELRRLEAFGARLITYAMPDYPELLKHIADPPPVLMAHGHVHLWQTKPCIAIVGARNASANGCNFARKLARELGEAGVIVVSGLARGIDTFAHHGALASGTVAVIAGGIDNIYPAENATLYAQIREQGCILSEQPFGAAPQSRSFPSRNRIISGMSRGVLVVEASIKSGSLITGRFALDQGRDVFAVPGSPLDPRSQGCNALLKEGAILTENVDDILDALRGSRTPAYDSQRSLFEPMDAPEPSETELAAARETVSRLLGSAPVCVDLLLEQSGLPANLLLTILLEKELAGMLQRHPGNKVSLIY